MLGSKTFWVWLTATFLMRAITCGKRLGAQEEHHSVAPAADSYRIVAGDVIPVSVYQHPELSRRVVVRSDGNISLPSIEALKASGLSAMGLEASIREKLQSTNPKPQVNPHRRANSHFRSSQGPFQPRPGHDSR
ncbi:MAG: polysaccharide biosynthesis/export family protein [Candidatus Acidiferrum sp.]